MSWKNSFDMALVRSHAETLDYIYLKYFDFQSPVGPRHISEADRAELSQLEAMASALGDGLPAPTGKKCAVPERNPDFHNGLPRHPGWRG